MCSSRSRCAPPSLLQRPASPTNSSPAPVAMASPRLLLPGKLAGSRGRTSLCSPMARCAVLPIRPFRSTNGARKSMAACGWCMPPAFGVVGPVRCVSSVNGVAQQRQSRARSASCCIQWWSVRRRSCGVIGVEGSIGGPASSSCATNGWRSRCSRQVPRSPALPHRFPVLSGPIRGSTGKSGWLAMRRLSPLDRSRSSSLASQNPLPLRSVWPARKMALFLPFLFLGQVCLSEGTPAGLFSSRALAVSSLRPCVALLPLWFCSLTGHMGGPARFSLTRELLPSSARSLRIPWDPRRDPVLAALLAGCAFVARSCR